MALRMFDSSHLQVADPRTIYMSQSGEDADEVPQGAYVFVFLLAFAALCATMFVFPLWSA